MGTITNEGLLARIATAALAAYTRVKFDPDNDGQVIVAGANEDAIGITEDDALAAGDPVTVRTFGRISRRVAAEAISQYADVYNAASGRVSDTKAGKRQGIALTAASNAGEWITVLEVPDFGDIDGLVNVIVADSTAVTASGASVFDNGTKTLDGASLKVGDIIRVRVGVDITTTTGSETVTLTLKVGTETIIATGAVDVSNGDLGYIEADVVVRAIGASGALLAYGTYALGTQGTVTALPFRKAQASEDLSGDVAVTVTTTHSSTGESVELEHFSVEIVRQ